MIYSCITFDLWTIDWTAIGSLIALAMIIFTCITLRQNERQVKIIEKQNEDANTPKFACSLYRGKDSIISLKIENVSSAIAYNLTIAVEIQSKISNRLFTDYVDKFLSSAKFMLKPYGNTTIPLYITYYAEQDYEEIVTITITYNGKSQTFSLPLNSVHFPEI